MDISALRRLLAALLLALLPNLASAESLCDPAHEDCRARLIQLIRAEQTGIDVAFWFMEDSRYSNELVARARAGVPVRVLVDPRANSTYPLNASILAQLASAGIPMRRKSGSGILHWKMMLFAGQRTVEFSGANYSPWAFSPVDPYRNYTDEAIFFSDDPAVVESFMRRFDDLWIDRVRYADYANIGGTPGRRYPQYSIAPELNFAPQQSYRSRSVAAYQSENQSIDAIMYRVTDRAHSDALIAANDRGVRVRLLTEQAQYRDPTRLWHAWNIDRLYMAGVEIRHRAHAGLNHQKSVVLRGRGMTIFGSSNWTSPSSDSQEEHNYFTTKGWITAWFEQQFERKWNNLGPAPETQPFQPLPPDAPEYRSPANRAVRVTDSALVFSAGPFAHVYDIYFGTSPNPPLIEGGLVLGPTEPGGSPRRYQLPTLTPNTTYYWRIVARTMAQQARGGQIWSFSTGGQIGPPPPPPPPPPQPTLTIDTPGKGAVVRQPFLLAGWAIDTAAGSGPGMDVVHVYAYPNPGSGAPPRFVGAAATGIPRPDVAAAFGAQFHGSGYGLIVAGLAPGPYMLVAFGHSVVSGTFAISQSVHVQIPASTAIVLDVPLNGSAVGPVFPVAGWAIDVGAVSGNGVDVVHVWAHRLDAAVAPTFVGAAFVGVSRPDVGAIFGSRFGRAGFGLLAQLPPGRYLIAAHARSLVSGTFSAIATAEIVVGG